MFNQPSPPFVGACESTPDMTEEGVRKNSVIESSHIHSHEWA
jgi:hypothetical protein